MTESIDMINELYDNLKHNFPDWKFEIAQCKDINYTYGNPMKLYFDGSDYVVTSELRSSVNSSFLSTSSR